MYDSVFIMGATGVGKTDLLCNLRSNEPLFVVNVDSVQIYKKLFIGSAKPTPFQKKKIEIFGVSKDTLKSHEGFKDKFNFPFELISDPDEKVCKIFDVIKEKSMYGKKYMGIERSTFLIGTDGKLINEWRKVKVKGHVEEILKNI